MVANDDDQAKLERLRAGRPWFHEPGLPELLAETIDAGRLRFTADKGEAVRHGQVIFICVGTPTRTDGSPNLQYLESWSGPTPSAGRPCWPSCTGRSSRPPGAPFLATDRATAELIKHASNAFLATKISFINTVAAICERSGADVALVARGMALDPRIGVHFLKAGAGYGGSCFPKDVAAFAHRSAELGVDFGILREAPAMDVVRGLLAEGAEEVAYDPVAGDQAVDLLPEMKLAPNRWTPSRAPTPWS